MASIVGGDPTRRSLVWRSDDVSFLGGERERLLEEPEREWERL